MGIRKYASKFKQAHQLQKGDVIALHYGEPAAHVIRAEKIQDVGVTLILIEVPNNEPVRYTD